jgi:hypothetical protein
MIRSPLYLTIIPEDVSLDTPHGSREGRLYVANDSGIIQIAKGRRDDLFGLANKLFGARHGAWTNAGEQAWQYPLQDTEGSPVQLTEREKRIIVYLGEPSEPKRLGLVCSYLSLQETGSANPDYDSANVRSALLFLYQNGYLVVENSNDPLENRYSVRRGNQK